MESDEGAHPGEVNPPGTSSALTVDAALEIQEALLVGAPLEWPDGLDGDYGPHEVAAALEEAVDMCPALREARPVLDCGEFPCILWLNASKGSGAAPHKCEVWDLETSGPTVTSTPMVPGSGVVKAYPVAPADLLQRDDFGVEKRLEWRMRSGRDDAQAQWEALDHQ